MTEIYDFIGSSNLTCTRCGSLYVPHHKNQKICSDCEEISEEIKHLNSALRADFNREEFNPSEELEKTTKLVNEWNKKCLLKKVSALVTE